VGAPAILDSFAPQLEQQTHRKEFMIHHLNGPLPIRVLLGTNGPKEGAGLAVGKNSPQEKKSEPQEGRQTLQKMTYR
jgi:hypothetical protein